MRRKLILALSFAFIFGFMISCSDDDDDNGGGNPGPNPGDGPTNSLEADYNGDYTTGCVANNQNSTSEINNLNIENSVITKTKQKFSGTDCQSTNLVKREVRKFAVSKAGTYNGYSNGTTVIEVNNSSLSGTLAFFTEDAVTEANANPEEGYGFTDWAVGVERDMTQKFQSDAASRGKTYYTIEVLNAGRDAYVNINGYVPEKGDKNPDVEGAGHERYNRYTI